MLSIDPACCPLYILSKPSVGLRKVKKMAYSVVCADELEKSSESKRSPMLSVREPGRLRIRDVMAYFGISRSSVYVRIKDERLPAPDGGDPYPFWFTETVRPFLERGSVPSGKPVLRRSGSSEAKT